MKTKLKSPIKHICTDCGGDATLGWVNPNKKKNMNCFGAIIKPGERICMTCGKKSGVKFR